MAMFVGTLLGRRCLYPYAPSFSFLSLIFCSALSSSSRSLKLRGTSDITHTRLTVSRESRTCG